MLSFTFTRLILHLESYEAEAEADPEGVEILRPLEIPIVD